MLRVGPQRGERTVSLITLAMVVAGSTRLDAQTVAHDRGCAVDPSSAIVEVSFLASGVCSEPFYGAGMESVFNSGYPSDHRNGGLWAGRGVSARLVVGGLRTFGPATVVMSPSLLFQENRAFDTSPRRRAGRSPYAYPWWGGIDWPQRFGGSSFVGVDPAFAVAVRQGPVRITASTLNVHTGPARRYPLILGVSAAGFPHVGAALEPSTIGPLRLAGELLIGRLSESDYFDEDPSNDHRQLTVVSLTAALERYPELEVGVTLAHHLQLEPDAWFSSPFGVFGSPFSSGESGQAGTGNTPGNGLGSISLRWRPAPRREVYVEWGRDDYTWDLQDLLAEPDHSAAVTAGFLVGSGSDGAGWLVSGEVTAERVPQLSGTRGVPVWYTHARVIQGHTHRGQLLGSSLGPGSDGQYLAVDRTLEDTGWGIFVERIRWDDEAYLRYHSERYGFRGHDVELIIGGRHSRSLGEHLALETEAGLGLRRNRNFINLEGERFDFPMDGNVHVDLRLTWMR